MFKKTFSFEGRIRRAEYGLSYLIYIGVAITMASILDETDESALFCLAFIPLFWFMIAQGAKRCHDRGNSGWFQLIPFYGLFMLFGDSDDGENEYGPNPKGIGNHDDIDEIGKYLQ
jgi:uncharacterized membrane protein YhaH (DUF805 family)